MDKDTLFILPPGFMDNGRREYCPECAELWGLLSYYPAYMQCIDIQHVGINHPRTPINVLLGPGNHNVPTLVLAGGSPHETEAEIKHANGRAYIDSARQIGVYFSDRFGTARPRGT